MTSIVNDNTVVTLSCANCGRTGHPTLGWLKEQTSFNCPCGAFQPHTQQLQDVVQKIESVDNVFASL